MRAIAVTVFALCIASLVNAQTRSSKWKLGFGAEAGFLDYEGSRTLFNEVGARAELLSEGCSIPLSLFVGGGSVINSYNIILRFDVAYFVGGHEGFGLFCGIVWMKPFHDVSVWRQYGNQMHPPSLVTSNWLNNFSIESGVKLEFFGMALEGFIRYPLSPVIWQSRPIGRYYIVGVSGYYLFDI